MAAPVTTTVLDHEGPWTEEAYLALPEDPRIELLDGALLVSPYARGSHQRMSSRVEHALGVAAPDGLEVLVTVNVRVALGRLLIPDLVAITEPGLDELVYDAAVIAMVVEISGSNNPAMDRAIKPALYAAAGIPHYLRIELRGGHPIGIAYRLSNGQYVETVRSTPGEPLVLTDPIAATLDLARLASATRPPR